MNKITNIAATALLISLAAPASALIDPALEQQFLEAATRAVQAADLAASNPIVVEDIRTEADSVIDADINVDPNTYLDD